MDLKVIVKTKYNVYILFLFTTVCLGCESSTTQKRETWMAEIMAVEKSFNDMAQSEGLPSAFEYFAAEDGVLRRRNKIVNGKQAIRDWYDADSKPNETLTWKPTFVDVSASGDMAYTYGDFTFTYPDSLGTLQSNTGIFHTVWKRQPNGEWRFVWD